jgi:hypothetical protein
VRARSKALAWVIGIALAYLALSGTGAGQQSGIMQRQRSIIWR